MLERFVDRCLALAEHGAAAPAAHDVDYRERHGVVATGAAAVVLDQVDLERAAAGLVPGVAIDWDQAGEALRVWWRRPPAGLGSGKFNQAARQRRAADPRQLVEHLAWRVELTVAHQVVREGHQLRVEALGAAVIQHFPESLDRAQAGVVLARSAAARSRGWLRRDCAHAADGVLAVAANHGGDLVQESGLRRAAGRLSVTLAHGLHVLDSGAHGQASPSRCHRDLR